MLNYGSKPNALVAITSFNSKRVSIESLRDMGVSFIS